MNSPDPSIDRIAELQQLITSFSQIQRAFDLPGTGKRESDVEHSYGLALTSWFIASRIAPELNIEKILKYALVHDLIEIHSGDTFIFDEEMVKTKDAREAAALQKLKQEWTDFTDMTDYIEGYAQKRDAEAKFVYTIDKLIPPILVNMGEKDAMWNRNKVTRQMHEAEKNKKMKHSPEAEPYLAALNDWMTKPDYFYMEQND